MNKKIGRRAILFTRKKVRVPFPTTLLQKIGLVLFGICLCLVLLEAGLRLGGVAFLFFQESQNLRAMRSQGYRIMCLGESTTAGEYPRFLEEELNKQGQGIRFNVIDKGIPSTNTNALLAQLEANLDKYKPDLVVAMMGINDRGEHMPREVKSSSEFVRWLLSWRVVKLTRLLQLHLTKTKKTTEVKTVAQEVPGPPGTAMAQEIEDVENFGLIHARELLGSSRGPYSAEEAKFLDDGWEALADGDIGRAERQFKKILAINPENAQAYYGLAWTCRNGVSACNPEASLLRIIDLNMASPAVYIMLGDLYFDDNKYEQAEAAYKKAEVLAGEVSRTALSLAAVYMAQAQYPKVEAVLKRCVAELSNGLCFKSLISFYIATGKERDAALLEQRSELLFGDGSAASTVKNYRDLKAILNRRKIKLVCVQYPMRKVSALQNIFTSRDGVFFVDNERTFKAAVVEGRFHKYFRDLFAGDFGHCTELGNKLLAGNIAKVILRDVLGLPVSKETLNY